MAAPLPSSQLETFEAILASEPVQEPGIAELIEYPGYNPAQFATDESAAAIAAATGSQVVYTEPVGPLQPPEQAMLDFGPTTDDLNAALVIDLYSKYPADVANAIIEANLAGGGPSSYGAGAAAAQSNLPPGEAAGINLPADVWQRYQAALRQALDLASSRRSKATDKAAEQHLQTAASGSGTQDTPAPSLMDRITTAVQQVPWWAWAGGAALYLATRKPV
jgi:hypothetical protein